MRLLLVKAMRDLWHAKLRTIFILSAVILSVGLGIGLVNATKDVNESFDRRYETTNYEDIDILFETGAPDISAVRSIPGVAEAQGRLFLDTQAEYEGEKYEAHWLSAPYHTEKPYAAINGYHLFSGSYIASPEARECLVGNLFADEHGIEPGDNILLRYGNVSVRLNVSGIVGSPEYLYVVGDAGWPQPGKLLPVFTTYEFAVDFLNLTHGTYNELLIRTSDRGDREEVKKAAEGLLTAEGLRIERSLLGTEELDYQFARADADGMEKTGWAFGFIVLAVTAVVIYNTMNRLIATQRSYIGVMGALGGRRSRILLHYCLFGLLLGLVGSALGILFGIGVWALIVYAYTGLIGLSEPVYTVFWIYPVIFTTLGILLTTAGAFLGSLRTLSIGPREALTSQYHTAVFSRKPFLEKVFDVFGARKRIFLKIPLRNLTRHRVRTLVTVIALAFSMILVFATIALTLSFMQPIEDNYDHYEKWDLNAGLLTYHDRSAVEATTANLTSRGFTAEPALRDFVAVTGDDELVYARIQAFGENSTLRKFNVIDGKKDPDRGILVGSILARSLDLEPGDSVTFVLGNSTSTAEIAGITGELMDDSFLMTLSQADFYLHTDGRVNSVLVSTDEDRLDEAESILRSELPVGSISRTDDVVNGMESLLESLLAIFLIFIAFGILAEVLFISTTVVLNILDREMEFISLRAMGADPWRIRRTVIGESVLLLLASLIIGLPLGLLSTKWTMAYLVEDLMYFQLNVGPAAYVITAAIALLATLAASYVSARHITKQNLADTIRNKMIS